MKSEQKRSFVRGAAILGLAGLVCKVIGALFRIPLYNLLEDGMAYYEAVYPYYSWLLVVSSAGIPTAISRMVAERVAMGDHAGARRVFRRAQALLVGIGLVTTLIMFFGAGWFASLVEVGEGVVLSFRALAPALLFVSVMCAYRGYLQGLQCMSGTAVSQLVEQVVKLVAGLFFAAKLLPMGLEYAAMGALLGISLSELLALAVIALFYVRRRRMLPDMAAARAAAQEEGVIRSLLAIAVPVTIGASIMPMTGIIDSVLIVSTLRDIGFSDAEANLRYVALRTNVTTVINMPAVLTTSLAMSLVPAVSAARRRHSIGSVRSISVTAIKLSMIVGLPCAAGLFVLSEQVIDFLYDITPDRLAIAASLMRISSVGVVFLSLVQTLTGVIQGLGKQQVPVINLALGAAAKVALMLALMHDPAINIDGAAIATVACYAVAGLLDLFYLVRLARLSLNVWDLFGKPLLASLLMGGVTFLAEAALSYALGSTSLTTLLSVGVGVLLQLQQGAGQCLFALVDVQGVEVGRLRRTGRAVGQDDGLGLALHEEGAVLKQHLRRDEVVEIHVRRVADQLFEGVEGPYRGKGHHPFDEPAQPDAGQRVGVYDGDFR